MQTTDNRFATVAGEAYDMFETRERRDSGESYTTLKDEAPEWLRDLVHEAHGDMLPDDWRYETVQDALGWIHDNDADEDADAHEFADQAVDTYTGSRLAWLSSHLNRPNYVDEAVSEFGAATDFSVVDAIGQGQYMEALEVFGSVVDSLRERVEDDDS